MFAGIALRSDEEAKINVVFDKDCFNRGIVNDIKDWPICAEFKINGNRIGIYLMKSQAEDLFRQLNYALQEADRCEVERGLLKPFDEGLKP